MRLTINVTERDIMTGTCADAELCAIALAAIRATANHPRIWRVSVQPRTIKFFNAGNQMVCCRNLPRKAREFITNYDSGHSVRPISFGVNLPS